MTEHDWLTSADPAAMLAFVRGKGISDRKVTLFVEECWALARQRSSIPVEWWYDRVVNRDSNGGLWTCYDGLAIVVPLAERATILRDIFGNPFRPVKAQADWLTTPVLSIAQGIYDDFDFDFCPILADALEEAGCREEDLLRHLRGEERCWWCMGKGGYVMGAHLFPSYTQRMRTIPSLFDCENCGAIGWIPLRGPHCRGCWAIDLLLSKE